MPFFHLTEFVVFQSSGFYDVSQVLIADASSFQAFTAILDWLTHLALILWWYWSNTWDKTNLDHLKLLYREFQKYQVIAMSLVGGQPNKHTNPSYNATKHMECTFLLSDYC